MFSFFLFLTAFLFMLFFLFFCCCCVSFHFLKILKGFLHPGRSKVTRVTVGRDTKVFEFVKMILRPLKSQSERALAAAPVSPLQRSLSNSDALALLSLLESHDSTVQKVP